MTNLESIQEELAEIMKGLNFATAFNVIDLGYASSEAQLWSSFKSKFVEEKSSHSKLVDYSIEAFWKKVQFAFDFRGLPSSGFRVTGAIEERLLELQNAYKAELRLLFQGGQNFRHLPNYYGDLYCPVIWGFNIIFKKQNNWLAVLGYASD